MRSRAESGKHGRFVRCPGRKGILCAGFTLIEVLVVVAIIALLVAILLPSLIGARDASRAVVCASRLKHAGDSAYMWMQHLNGSQMPTNAGWAAGALKMASGQTALFTCPTDPNPTPIPAFLVDMYDGAPGASRPYATASPDGPFNRISRVGQGWSVNIQDEIRGCSPGGDNDTVDVEFSYPLANRGDTTIRVSLGSVSAGTNFSVRDWKGRTVIGNVKMPDTRDFTAPLLWGSFGMSVTAGSSSVKGNPVMLAEYNNWGIFPERAGNFPIHNLKANMRFRHGGTLNSATDMYEVDKRGRRKDPTYTAREKANVAFRDLHVEKVNWDRAIRQLDPIGIDYKASDTPTSYTSLWLGTPAPRPPGWQLCFR